MSTTAARRRPRCSWPSVASRRLSWATARWTAARSWVGLVGSARSSSASGRDGGSFSVRSISARSSSRRRWRSKAWICSRSSVGASPSSCSRRPPGGRACGGSAARRPRRRPSPRPGGRRPRSRAAPRRASRRPALGDRLADRLAQLVEVEPLAALVAALLADPPLQRLGLGGAEEVAVEEQLEDPPVLLRLGDRRRQRLAEVGGLGPRHAAERLEGVEQLRGPDAHALAAQLLAEGDDAAGRGRAGASPAQEPPAGAELALLAELRRRPARRRGRCRCGA